jgi:hypothetical protein
MSRPARQMLVGTARCAVTARKASVTCSVQRPTTLVAPLGAARTAQRAVPAKKCQGPRRIRKNFRGVFELTKSLHANGSEAGALFVNNGTQAAGGPRFVAESI